MDVVIGSERLVRGAESKVPAELEYLFSSGGGGANEGVKLVIAIGCGEELACDVDDYPMLTRNGILGAELRRKMVLRRMMF